MKIKFEIIETPDYILAVSDEEIKTGNFIVELEDLSVWIIQIQPNTIISRYKKIIGHQPLNNTPILQGVPLLPEMVVEDYIQNFIEPLLKKKAEENNTIDLDAYALGLVDSYKSATKTFSEDDLRKAIQHAKGLDIHGRGVWFKSDSFNENDIIQSLKQPKPKWFVAEMIQKSISEYEFKITTNSQGKEALVGTYE
jgi:protoheme ferro-lyase